VAVYSLNLLRTGRVRIDHIKSFYLSILYSFTFHFSDYTIPHIYKDDFFCHDPSSTSSKCDGSVGGSFHSLVFSYSSIAASVVVYLTKDGREVYMCTISAKDQPTAKKKFLRQAGGRYGEHPILRIEGIPL